MKLLEIALFCHVFVERIQKLLQVFSEYLYILLNISCLSISFMIKSGLFGYLIAFHRIVATVGVNPSK